MREWVKWILVLAFGVAVWTPLIFMIVTGEVPEWRLWGLWGEE